MTKSFQATIITFAGSFLSLHLFLLVLTLWFPATIHAEINEAVPADCHIQEAPCTLGLSGRKVTLDIQPKPVKAMKDLTFRVTITGGRISSLPYIDLGMPGMQMGPNRVILKEAGTGVYEGVGVIVRCPSGRRTWSATIRFPDLGEAIFIFDVID